MTHGGAALFERAAALTEEVSCILSPTTFMNALDYLRSLFSSLSPCVQVLAARRALFSLAALPESSLTSLVSSLHAANLAALCRVLAGVCCEDAEGAVYDAIPEDEEEAGGEEESVGPIAGAPCSHKALGLLRARRNRRACCENTLEVNHACVLSVPFLLERMVTLLQLANFLPSLSEFPLHMMVNQPQVCLCSCISAG